MHIGTSKHFDAMDTIGSGSLTVPRRRFFKCLAANLIDFLRKKRRRPPASFPEPLCSVPPLLHADMPEERPFQTAVHVIVPTIMKRHLLPCSLLCMLLAATTALGGPGDTFYEANLSLTRAARLEKEGDYKAALESGKKAAELLQSLKVQLRNGIRSGWPGSWTPPRSCSSVWSLWPKRPGRARRRIIP